MTSSEPEPTSPGSERMISATPAKPTTRPAVRSAVMRSCSASRPMMATKNGAEFNSTAATAGPARDVPSDSPISESDAPAPATAAQPQSQRERGSRPPSSGSSTSRVAAPSSARRHATMPGVV